ncbi:RNA polymerase sigma factor [Dokdonella koreensis DS-123]|uniref:RNA polymerase sigma factor n=1 Tax=Dokdonella koreensis DS-123 TaxID=1300342 RepID=A0A167G4Q5_9GAMM|nr:RNA polymerase sigma factor [Dokdonella koreensis DS-123]
MPGPARHFGIGMSSLLAEWPARAPATADPAPCRAQRAVPCAPAPVTVVTGPAASGKVQWPPPSGAAVSPVSDQDEITRLLGQARAGERAAWEALLRGTFGDLKRMARQLLLRGSTLPTLNATSLINEWYLRLAESGSQVPATRQHFFALSAKVMRQVICAYARTRLTLKRGGEQHRVELDEGTAVLDAESADFIAVDAALLRLGREDEDLVRVVECRFFAGMSEPETAQAMGISERTVRRLWTRARERLLVLLGETAP